jgi:hypothetical protein
MGTVSHSDGTLEIMSAPDGLGIDFSYGALAEEVFARSKIQHDTHSSSADCGGNSPAFPGHLEQAT